MLYDFAAIYVELCMFCLLTARVVSLQRCAFRFYLNTDDRLHRYFGSGYWYGMRWQVDWLQNTKRTFVGNISPAAAVCGHPTPFATITYIQRYTRHEYISEIYRNNVHYTNYTYQSNIPTTNTSSCSMHILMFAVDFLPANDAVFKY